MVRLEQARTVAREQKRADDETLGDEDEGIGELFQETHAREIGPPRVNTS